MEFHNKRKKIYSLLTALVVLSLCCTACTSGGKDEMPAVSEKEPVLQDSEEKSVETAPQENEPAQAEEEPQEKEESENAQEEEIVEADANVYGNTIGNIYNGGYYTAYEDGRYLMRNREGEVYLIDPVSKETQYLSGMDLYEMNYSGGKVYGILDTVNEQLSAANGQIMVATIDDENKRVSGEVLEERKPEYMYVVDDVIYYSDIDTHKLISYHPETEEEKALMEDAIYYPIVYKDRIIFQYDADGESLYSIPLEGGEPEKLNDMRSYWPIVYQDRIYYQGIEDVSYTLRCMKLDGSEDKELAGVEYETPVLCEDKLCFIDVSDYSTVSYLDLGNPEAGVQKLDLSDSLIALFMEDEEVISAGLDMSVYRLYEVCHLSYINGGLMFLTLYWDGNDSYIQDNAMYDFHTKDVELLPYFVGGQ